MSVHRRPSPWCHPPGSAVLLALLALSGMACGSSPEDRLQEARSLQAARDFEASLEPLRELLRAAPDDPELNHLYGLALLRTRQPEFAIWPLRKAAAHPERAVEDGLLLTRALLRGGSPHDAAQQAERVLELEPDHVEALRLLVEAKLDARRNEEVLADVERLLARVPDDPNALMSRLGALLNLGRVEEAEESLAALRKVAEDPEAPVEWQSRLCAASATFAREKGDPDAAETEWEACLERFPGEEVAVFGGVEFFDGRSKARRGLEILRRAHEAEPHHLLFTQALASRLAASGKQDEAEELLLAATRDAANETQAWLGLAVYHEQRDEVAKAGEALAKGLERMDEAPPSLVAAYVDLLIRAGDYEKAEELIADLEGEPLMVNLLGGRLHLARGEPAEALAALEEGLRLWPDNSVARWLAAQAAEQLGDDERALREYREAVRSDPANRDAVFDLVRWLEARGLDEEAMPILARYRNENPRDADALVLALRIASRLGQPRVVEQLVRRLRELPGQRAVVELELASIRAAQAGPAAGIDSIRRAGLDLTRPANGEVLGLLVEYLVVEGLAEEALEAVGPALAAHPDEARFYELRGRALRGAGDADPARRALERALELEPERPGALAELAALSAESGDREAAIALYDRAARAAPEDPSHGWAAIELVEASGDDAELERRLEALLKGPASHPQAADLMARRLLARDPERAFELARRAVRSGGGPGALETLGRAQLERGDAAGAARTLAFSLSQRSDSASTHYWLGRALVASGDEARARQAMQEALAAGEFPEREAARAELARLGEAQP